MVEINRFAFCFLSQYVEDVQRQEMELTKLSDKFLIERWYRKDRNESNYLSFSQMINDAIDDTDSEFMIFCNPKTNFRLEDIEFILNKLSNGYCFASVVSFGFFGFSKELIRRIGMLDERFIGGEFEDNDFAIRLKYFGKAVWWGYDNEKYNFYLSQSKNLKHISHSIFYQKYKINYESKVISINKDLFTHKKISKRHRDSNLQIYNSWISSENSYGEKHIGSYLTEYTAVISDFNKVELLTKFYLNIKKSSNNFFIELLSENKFSVKIVILQNFNKTRTFLNIIEVLSNTWYSLNIVDSYDNQPFYDDIEIRIFVDDNQIYNNTLTSGDEINLNFNLPILVEKNN